MHQGVPLYRLRIADGSEYGPSSEADIAASITAGRIRTDSWVALQPGQDYVPILQVPAFAHAFQVLAQAQSGSHPPAQAQAQAVAPPQGNLSTPSTAPHASFGTQPDTGGYAQSGHVMTGEFVAQFGSIAQAPPPGQGADFLFADSGEVAMHPALSGEVPVASEDAAAFDPGAPPAAGEGGEVSDFLEERKLWTEACRDLDEGRYPTARGKFERLAAMKPKTSEYQSSVAYCDFLAGANEKDRWAAMAVLREVHDQHPYCVPTLVYLARSHLKVGRPKGAVRFYKLAKQVEPQRGDITVELQRAEDAVLGKEVDVEKTTALEAFKESWAARQRGSSTKKGFDETEELDPLRLSMALGAWALLSGLLFVPAVILKMGSEEYFYTGDGFFFIRRATLFVFAFGLSFAFLRDERLDFSDFDATPKYLLIGILWGGLVGFMSPTQAVRKPLGFVLLLTFFHVLAEEAFFRVYLARMLNRAMTGVIGPTLVGALLYGVYHMTYFSFAADPSVIPVAEGVHWASPEAAKAVQGFSTASEAWMSVGLISIFAGVPYFLLYYVSRSFTAPFVCHLVVNSTMMILSTT